MGEGIKLPVINGLGRTDRIDKWWTQPLWMGLALTVALFTAWRLILFPESIDYELEGSGRLTNLLTEHPRMEFVWTQ